jgi:hypothetical protein
MGDQLTLIATFAYQERVVLVASQLADKKASGAKRSLIEATE